MKELTQQFMGGTYPYWTTSWSLACTNEQGKMPCVVAEEETRGKKAHWMTNEKWERMVSWGERGGWKDEWSDKWWQISLPFCLVCSTGNHGTILYEMKAVRHMTSWHGSEQMASPTSRLLLDVQEVSNLDGEVVFILGCEIEDSCVCVCTCVSVHVCVCVWGMWVFSI